MVGGGGGGWLYTECFRFEGVMKFKTQCKDRLKYFSFEDLDCIFIVHGAALGALGLVELLRRLLAHFGRLLKS